MGHGRKHPFTCCCPNDLDLTYHDACMCGCGYLNGPVPLIVAQFLAFVGACFSFAALGDCAFAEITEHSVFKQALNVTRIGFWTFEKPDGSCYHYDQFTNVISEEDQVQWYIDFLGATWHRASIVAGVASFIAFCLFFYSTSYCCSSQIKALRHMTGFVMSIVMVIIQGCTFVVFGSAFCDDNGCTFSRSAGFAVGAMLCYFFAGIAFFATIDYPGELHMGEASYRSESKSVPMGAAVAAIEPPSVPSEEAEESP